MVTPLTQAQRYYRRGDFNKVVALLAGAVDEDDVDSAALTLLGNTYRQLGSCRKVKGFCSKPLTSHPNRIFPGMVLDVHCW